MAGRKAFGTLTGCKHQDAMAPCLSTSTISPLFERMKWARMERQPVAFLSYVRSDDDHDNGQITAFRKRLEGEVRMHTGAPFAIFQDRNDISWGQQWEERINKSLSNVTFLIPILTPSFFRSPACRSEFSIFSRKEKLLGLNRLILPLYYMTCDEFGDTYKPGSDEIADTLRLRNWNDWRKFRFKQFADEAVAAALADMAGTIKISIRELMTIGDLPDAKASASQAPQSTSAFLEILAQDEILSSSQLNPSDTPIEEAAEVPDFSAFGPSGTYHAFTKAFDEVIDASDLAEQAEIVRLHKYIERFSKAFRKIHEVSLASYLAAFIPKESTAPLCVSILIDNSGSMRGEPIAHTAAWCNVIAEWMDRLRISTEFLGFTTRAWKGGQSKEAWIAAGKPSNPGRLNDLRHLIYKSFSASVGAAAPNFGMMAREGLLKENIDGEAVLWAFSRIEKQTSPNKLLIVVSDGAPVDHSTLSVNPGNYLEKHLLEAIHSISSKVRLYAIGIGHDVSRYYPNAATAKDA